MIKGTWRGTSPTAPKEILNRGTKRQVFMNFHQTKIWSASPKTKALVVMKFEKILHASKSLKTAIGPELRAACLYIQRRNRSVHPEGYFDRAGRWFAQGRDAEVMEPCRTPSRAWPYSEMNTCRSLNHCAKYFDADPLVTHRIVTAIRHICNGSKLTKPAEPYATKIRLICLVASLYLRANSLVHNRSVCRNDSENHDSSRTPVPYDVFRMTVRIFLRFSLGVCEPPFQILQGLKR